MGWCRGSELAEKVWLVVRPFLSLYERERLAPKIIDLFEDEDCDTMEEATALYKDGNKSKLNEDDIKNIRISLDNGILQSDIALAYDVDSSIISRIKSKEV